jgi:hypothetical protein
VWLTRIEMNVIKLLPEKFFRPTFFYHWLPLPKSKAAAGRATFVIPGIKKRKNTVKKKALSNSKKEFHNAYCFHHPTTALRQFHTHFLCPGLLMHIFIFLKR